MDGWISGEERKEGQKVGWKGGMKDRTEEGKEEERMDGCKEGIKGRTDERRGGRRKDGLMDRRKERTNERRKAGGNKRVFGQTNEDGWTLAV